MKLSDLRWDKGLTVSCNFMTPHGSAFVQLVHGQYRVSFFNADAMVPDEIYLDDVCMLAMFLVQCEPLHVDHKDYDGELYYAKPHQD